MDKPTYLRQLRKLNRAFIEANRRLQDGEIIEKYLPPKRYVVLKATGVNTTSNCEISYQLQELNADDTLGLKCYLYGYEWENYKPTGKFYDLEEDLC